MPENIHESLKIAREDHGVHMNWAGNVTVDSIVADEVTQGPWKTVLDQIQESPRWSRIIGLSSYVWACSPSCRTRRGPCSLATGRYGDAGATGQLWWTRRWVRVDGHPTGSLGHPPRRSLPRSHSSPPWSSSHASRPPVLHARE